MTLAFSQKQSSHIKNIQIVFDLLRREGLKFKPNKCTFLQKEVEYLGHNVTKDMKFKFK